MLGNICQVSLRLERECLLSSFFPPKISVLQGVFKWNGFLFKIIF